MHSKKLRNISIDLYVWQLQFKILHTRVIANKSLNKIAIKDSGLCNNCKVAVVTTEHLFLYCQIAINFWVEIERWISEMLQRRIKLDRIQKIFGDQDFNRDINLILILAKRTIYKLRLRGSEPKAEYTKATLRTYLSTLRYTSIIGIGRNSHNFQKVVKNLRVYLDINVRMEKPE